LTKKKSLLGGRKGATIPTGKRKAGVGNVLNEKEEHVILGRG